MSAANLDCATAFRKIALHCVALIEAHHEAACNGDAEAVHQIRVAITRLRAAVAFFAPFAIDTKWLPLKEEITWLNASLGAARDCDVAMGHVRRKRYRAWAERMIGDKLRQRQAKAHRQLIRCLHSTRFRRLLAAMRSWIGSGSQQRAERDGDEPLQAYCRQELERWRERLIRKGRHLDTMSAPRRHRLRIRAKRFRYMLEALTQTVAVYGRGEFRHVHRPAKRLQRVLGDLRDLERLAEIAAELSSKDPKRDCRPPGYRRRSEALLDSAIEAHRNLRSDG